MRQLAPTFGWAALVVLIFYVLFNFPSYGLVDRIQAASEFGKTTILDTRFGYTSDQAYVTLKSLTAEGRALYKNMLLIDLMFPFFYLWFLWALLGRWAIPYLSFAIPAAWLLPLLVALADLSENVIILTLIYYYPDFDEALGKAAGIITRFKLAGFVCCLALAALGWIVANTGRKELKT